MRPLVRLDLLDILLKRNFSTPRTVSFHETEFFPRSPGARRIRGFRSPRVPTGKKLRWRTTKRE